MTEWIRNYVPASVSIYLWPGQYDSSWEGNFLSASPRNQIEAQRSGFDLERRSSVVSELSRLRGSERYAACDDEDTAAELGCGIGRVCPVIPPAGIGVCAALTLPDRHYAGDVRGETATDGLRGYPSLYPRKPQSREGSRLIKFLYGIHFPNRRLARPTAAPGERKL